MKEITNKIARIGAALEEITKLEEQSGAISEQAYSDYCEDFGNRESVAVIAKLAAFGKEHAPRYVASLNAEEEIRNRFSLFKKKKLSEAAAAREAVLKDVTEKLNSCMNGYTFTQGECEKVLFFEKNKEDIALFMTEKVMARMPSKADFETDGSVQARLKAQLEPTASQSEGLYQELADVINSLAPIPYRLLLNEGYREYIAQNAERFDSVEKLAEHVVRQYILSTTDISQLSYEKSNDFEANFSSCLGVLNDYLDCCALS